MTINYKLIHYIQLLLSIGHLWLTIWNMTAIAKLFFYSFQKISLNNLTIIKSCVNLL
jgi:hypothetical protein